MFPIGTPVLDSSTARWGYVKAIHAPNEYISPHNHKPVNANVLELDTGDSFVLRNDASDAERFVQLDVEKASFLAEFQTRLAGFIAEQAQACKTKMTLTFFAMMANQALKRQAFELEKLK